jgi:large subunit ribosomal protein L6
MSRIGKKPIPIPKDVKIDMKGDLLTIKGSKGELERKIHPRVNVNTDNNQLFVLVNDDTAESRSLHGL